MSTRLLCTSLAALICAGSAAAQTGRGLKPRYTFRHAGADREFETVAEGNEIAVYEKGRARRAVDRRVVTPGVLVRLKNPADAAAVARAAGASAWRRAPVLADAVILEFAGKNGEALPAAERLRSLPAVSTAEPLLARQQSKRWIPNDPYFAYNAANAGYQWHLRNTGQNGGTAGVDINLISVWDNWRGSGIRIGIIDDGMQTAHPDLSPNADTSNDYDWNGGDDDPSPSSADTHGSSCAGVAAARGNNGTGVTGAAPEATLVGLRLIAFGSTDVTESQAMLHRNDIIQIKSNSWGPDDTGDVIEGPGTLTAEALREAAVSGRGGLGTVICWAGGNGLADGDDSNFDGYANSIYVIAVGALTDTGTQAYYSESGANLLVTAPSDGGGQGISTTDLTGNGGYNSGAGGNFASSDYTNDFGGTSSATPLAAGGIALLLQSKPTLGWRDVKEILLRTAVKSDAADPGWLTNAAGYHFNDKYGAGLLNTQAAVTMAAGWTNLGPMLSQSVASSGSVSIPDNSTAGAVKTFVIAPSATLRVEQAALSLAVSHGERGQLEVLLTSPSGTVSKLARARPDTAAGLNWTFTTPQFWGESAAGTWTLRVRDTATGTTGNLTQASLTLHGTGSAGIPAITSSTSAAALVGQTFSFQATATNSPTSWSASGLPPGLTLNTSSGLISGTPSTAGVFPVNLTAYNAAVTGIGVLTITVTAPPVDLAEAVDAAQLTFATSGTAWFSETAETHDGVDAAQSGDIADSETSAMETTLTGPLMVSFWWKVSSESGYDFLRFSLDGTSQRSISGTVAWTQVGLFIPPGFHTLRWSYEKDNGLSIGSDAGWVDQIAVHPVKVPLSVSGTGTGFQSAPLDAIFSPWTGGELGWVADSGKVAEAGNRTPPLTGPVVAGTAGVKSFDINNATTTLTTCTVDTAGFTNIRAEADVRAFTTNTSGTTSFEASDRLRIYTEVSADAITWSAGPDILPNRTGGSPDNLIELNTSGNSTYVHFISAAGAIAPGQRYVRIIVSGATNAASEHLIIDNLRITGTQSPDADKDGFAPDVESWFGTSDTNAAAMPVPAVSRTPSGATVSFPSVSGNSYAVDYSNDLLNWTTVLVTGSSSSTQWVDPAGPAGARRYYRVRKP